MKKLKLAIVSDAIYPYNKGGKEKRIYEISTRLAQKGIDIHIYSMKWWKGEEKTRVENDVTLHAISPLYPLYSGKRRSIGEAILFSLHCLKLIKEDFDVIDVDHMPHLVLFTVKIVCLIKGRKMIGSWNEVWGRAYWQEYLGSPKGLLAYVIEKTSVQLPDTIISISDHTTKKLKNELHVKNPIYTIPLGIDQKAIDALAPAKQTFDVMFSGRLLSHKNASLLVEAIGIVKKKHPTVSCVIVGEGPDITIVKALIKKLQLEKNVTLLSFFEKQNDMYALMKSSKMFVLPSLREGFGLVTIEANAANIPVIVVNHPDNAAKDLIINGKNGFIVKNNPDDMAQKIEELLKNKKKEYKQYVQKYSWDSLINKLIPIYTR